MEDEIIEDLEDEIKKAEEKLNEIEKESDDESF